jgi:shikimate dehydrogenase
VHNGPDAYCVIGNPIAHSRSPEIHTAFAAAYGQAITYDRLLAPVDGFSDSVRAFVADGGRGMNVTVPFKEDAAALADVVSPRVQLAGAANTLTVRSDGLHADNTDGIGLVRDLTGRHAVDLHGQSLVLLGAGGACRGVLLPLIESGVASIHIVNRTHPRAESLAGQFREVAAQSGCLVQAVKQDDLPAMLGSVSAPVWINATSAGLGSDESPVPAALLSGAGMVYDMMYGAQPTAFLRAAQSAGCQQTTDGLGMLVEQAAESFRIWRGVRPDTNPVFDMLRRSIASRP